MSQFFTLPTKIGQGLISNAIAYNEPLTIATMAIGDGGGKLPSPDASVTRLVNEVRRGPINQITTDPDNPNWIIAEQVLPPDVGGWTIREVGLYDTDGNLVAYGNYPETYKPQLSEGSSRTQTIRFVMETTDTSAVTLRIDPSVVMASRKYVDDQLDAHAKSRNHPDADTKNKGFARYATVAESKKGEEAKAAQTPAGGMAQLDDHRKEEDAHVASSIKLNEELPVFAGATKLWSVLFNLGNAARKTVGRAVGNVMEVGAFGIGSGGTRLTSSDDLLALPPHNELYTVTGSKPRNYPEGAHEYGQVIYLSRGTTADCAIIVIDSNRHMFYNACSGASWKGWVAVLTSEDRATVAELISGTAGKIAGAAELKQALGSAAWANIATQSEVNAGTAERVVTADRLRFGIAYRLSTTGYVMFPKWIGGLVLQWGVVNVANPPAGRVVDLPIEFPNSFLIPFCSYRQTQGNAVNDRNTGCAPVGRTQIALTGEWSTEMTFHWRAIGY
ncbi:phage tail protein [Kushneria phyllosphaerae]|uniref:Uncharacterized protein n=1 Tax=Kushneria phyllosphaerae TaxID=2100822 RepID=A0A2R8CKT4_9GAMM|nr:phage tail protein [Kushneria phyllosphaerae]SPJ33432.1 hypothetical protein KSP9073_01441 [Kushneria phyllosphaerae]